MFTLCRLPALPQGLLDDDKVGDREALALPEMVLQAETEGLPEAVGEAFSREALGWGEGEGESVPASD